MEPTNWKFFFHTLELTNFIGIDREVMTIYPVSDPFTICQSQSVYFWDSLQERATGIAIFIHEFDANSQYNWEMVHVTI